VVADCAHFMKSLDIDHARDGEVMIAYAMKRRATAAGQRISPAARGMPGWYATYWVKMSGATSRCWISPDTNYWTKVAYTIPDTPHASIKPAKPT